MQNYDWSYGKRVSIVGGDVRPNIRPSTDVSATRSGGND
jgi:hypothetical protein